MAFYRYFFYLVLLALAACSKSRPEAEHSLVREIPVESFQGALTLSADARLQCNSSVECPANVGLFIAKGPTSVATCTSFLLAEDIVATNSHCLPSVVKQLPDLCPERIEVLFAASGNLPEERFQCEALLLASERPNTISPDLALIRVKKTGRLPLPISRTGVEPLAIHSTYKINPGKDASGLLIKQDCLSVPSTYRFPLYEEASDPIFVVGDCPSVPGNSGAPLINKNGYAVGVFQADLALSQKQREAWGPHLLPGEEFTSLALGTSLICVSAENLWNSSCQPIDPESIVRPRIEDFSLDQETGKLIEHFTKDLAIFQWKQSTLSKKTLERETSIIPDCVNPLEGWIERYHTRTGIQEEATLLIELPRLAAKIFFNRYTQVSAKVALVGTHLNQLSFHPKALAETGSTTLLLDDSAASTIRLCP